MQNLIADLMRGHLDAYLIIAGGGIFLVFAVCMIYSSVTNYFRVKRYIKLFQSCFTGEMRTTLQALQDNYRKSSMMGAVIRKALFYLEHSIRRDYEGTLKIIERALESKKVVDLHKVYLAKIPPTYYLPKKY